MVAKLRPYGPTIVSFVVGLPWALVHLWDWFDRSNSFQTWLNANKASVPGQLATQLVANGWVFVVLALLLWWRDYDIRRTEQTTPSPILANALEMDTLRQRVNELSSELAGARTAAMSLNEERDRAIATAADIGKETAALRTEIQKIAPLILLYRSTNVMADRLQSFADDMERAEPGVDIKSVMQEFARIGKINAEAYSRDFRSDLVKLTTQLKQEYGLVNPQLTDDALARDVWGQLGARPLVEGLREISDKLRDMIMAATADLNVE